MRKKRHVSYSGNILNRREQRNHKSWRVKNINPVAKKIEWKHKLFPEESDNIMSDKISQIDDLDILLMQRKET